MHIATRIEYLSSPLDRVEAKGILRGILILRNARETSGAEMVSETDQTWVPQWHFTTVPYLTVVKKQNIHAIYKCKSNYVTFVIM